MKACVFTDTALRMLEKIQHGALTLKMPDGKTLVFQGAFPGPEAVMTLHDTSVIRNAALKGDIGLGEDYVAGRWDTDSIESLFSFFLLNIDSLDPRYMDGSWLNRCRFVLLDRVFRRNSRAGSRSNISHHYDVGNEFYKLWLDETMTYSSALFSGGTDDLAQAQRAKYKRILDRAATGGDSILEIGCGWGGFAETAAESGCHVTGLTVSAAQHDYARERLGSRADIRLQDYRDSSGAFDGIVSIEMFEAVGERYWPDYFKTVSSCLKKGGRAVVQTITIGDGIFGDYRRRSDFIRRHVFPGGMLPSAQAFVAAAEKAGLACADVFSFGHDYARTLREWLVRFDARHAQFRAMGYTESFIRNWRFYLGFCAAAFAVGRTNVMQVELHHAS